MGPGDAGESIALDAGTRDPHDRCTGGLPPNGYETFRFALTLAVTRRLLGGTVLRERIGSAARSEGTGGARVPLSHRSDLGKEMCLRADVLAC